MQLTVQILQTNGLNNPNISLSVASNGINVNGTQNAGPATSLVVTVPDNGTAEITVSQTGFYTYTTKIHNVYNLDKTIQIVMVPTITDISDPDYNRPSPWFFYFADPCSFKVDFYSGSSFAGQIEWYVNNELLVGSVTDYSISVCSPGTYQLKMRSTTCDILNNSTVIRWDRYYANTEEGNVIPQIVSPVSTYLALDTLVNLTVADYRVCLSLAVETEVQPLCTENACCYPRDEDVVIIPTWTLNRPGSNPANYTITWEVTDPDGLTLALNQSTFVLSAPPLTIQLPFTLEKLGFYTVKATIFDSVCGNTFESVLLVETCNFVVITYAGCNTFNISNKSSATDMSFNITDLEGNVVNQGGALQPGASIQATFKQFGLYIVNVTYTRDNVIVQEKYVLNGYCELEACLSQYIMDLLCVVPDRCNPCPPETELNQVLLLYNAYFMKVNKLFATNNFYTALEDGLLAELTSIQQIMDKIYNFCSRKNCLNGENSAFAHDAGSETWDWAGKGSNCEKSCGCSPISQTGSYYNTQKPGYCNTCGGNTK